MNKYILCVLVLLSLNVMSGDRQFRCCSMTDMSRLSCTTMHEDRSSMVTACAACGGCCFMSGNPYCGVGCILCSSYIALCDKKLPRNEQLKRTCFASVMAAIGVVLGAGVNTLTS